MVIRSYTADSVASALKQVRTDMGGDAVVLKTRVVDSAGLGKMYEVTACLDKPTVEQANQVLASKAAAESVAVAEVTAPVLEEIMDDVAPVDEPITTPPPVAPIDANRLKALDTIEAKLDQLLNADQVNRIGQQFVPQPVAQAISAMQRADIPERCIAEIFDGLKDTQSDPSIDTESIRQALIRSLNASIDLDFDLKPGDRVLVAGPAGSGKTSLIGRLAAWLMFEKKTTVKLISLDNVKVGAIDEIASYADLLGVDEINTSDNLKVETATQDDDKVVLIDTCALPFDPEQLSELKEQVESLKPTHRLGVFSTLTRSSDIENFAGRMAWLEPTHLVFTMIDLTNSVGSLLAGTAAMDTRVAMITNSPSGADSFHTPNAEALADAILGREADGE